ncbi:glycosyltransferase family protein [Methanogenium organophilum]|uniref:Uncharacterized protein n=1 Tax=Methanogenium organophilum TaxID=2199 RepID=A0A9X9S2U8_METOG|nr:hypothetical protein [Methanogenium organophilum]WAI00854.1 hypothetical protein OU421_10585 [Methanogenium organophilum]
MDSSHIKKFAGHLPLILVAISIAGLLLGGLVFSRWDYSIRGLAVAIPFGIAAVFLHQLFTKNGDCIHAADISKISQSVLFKIYALLFIVSLMILVLGIERHIYLVSILGLYTIILVQIVSQKCRVGIVLGETIFTMLNVIYGVTFSYPLYFSTTDVMSHIFMAKVTLLSGHTIPLDLQATYSPFPLYHIFIAACSNLLNLPIQETLFLVTSLLFALTILFIFCIFRFLTSDDRLPLLTCLFYSMTSVVVLEGIQTITRSFAYIGFVILLYLIFKQGGTEKDKRVFQGLAILMVLFIIFVHQVSIAQIVILLLIFMVVEYFFTERTFFSTHFMQFIIVLFLGYWLFAATNFLNWLTNARMNLNFFDIGTKHTVLTDPAMSQENAALIFLNNNLDISIFTVFAIIGIGYMLWRQKPKYLTVIGLFSLITIVLYLPNPIFTSETIVHLFRLDRFWILISPFMAFSMACGLMVLMTYSQGSRSHRKIAYSLIFFAVFLFMVASLYGVVIPDSSDQRRYFYSEELDGFNFILDKVPYGSNLGSDYQTSRFFIQDYCSLSDTFELPYYDSTMLNRFYSRNNSHDYSIIRERAFLESGIIITDINYRYIYHPTAENALELTRYVNRNDLIYSNGNISVVGW